MTPSDGAESDTTHEVETTTESYLRPSQVAALLLVSAQTVRRWAVEGKLRCIVTAGGHRRFPHSDVQRLRRRLQADAVRTSPIER